MHISTQLCRTKLQSILFAALILLIIPSFYACDDLGVETSASGPLLPLVPGNIWRYLVYSSLADPVDTLTVRIERQSMVETGGVSHQFSAWRTQVGVYPSPYEFLYSNVSNGLKQIGITAPLDTIYTLSLYLKCPVGLGDSWEVPIVEYDPYAQKLLVSRIRRIECVDVKAQLDTPAGSFVCIVYHWRERPSPDVLDEWDYLSYWSPGVGWIGEVVSSTKSGYHVISKRLLYQYTISDMAGSQIGEERQ